MTVVFPIPQPYPRPTMTREEAINMFRELDEAGFLPALSVMGKGEYLVQLHLEGMRTTFLKKAMQIMDRSGDPDEGPLVRVEGQFLVAR